MRQEVLFAKTLEQVRALAKEQGNCVSEKQVQDAFAALELDNDQMQMVFDYLVKHKVGIGQPVDPDDYLTDEEKDYLQDYLDEIARLPVYSDGEIMAHTISAMAGDVSAQNILIQIYLKDVAEIAKLYAGQGVFLEDLIGEGNVALTMGVTMLGCLEHAAEAEGMLGKMIMDAMEDFINENRAEEDKDKKVLGKVKKVARKAKELSDELRRKVTVEELSAETGMSESAITEAMQFSGYTIEEIENPS